MPGGSLAFQINSAHIWRAEAVCYFGVQWLFTIIDAATWHALSARGRRWFMEVAMTVGMRAVVFVVVLIVTSFSVPAKAGFSICNRTKETVDVAVVYISHQGQMISRGWFVFKPCERCNELVKSSATPDQNFSYYAKGDQGTEWRGGERYCVRFGDRFLFSGAQATRCSGARGGVMRGFRRATSGSVNLTSNTSSCGTID